MYVSSIWLCSREGSGGDGLSFSGFGLLAEFDWSFFFRLIQGRAFVVLLCNGRLMDREIGSFKITSFVIIGLLVGPMLCIPLHERLVLPE